MTKNIIQTTFILVLILFTWGCSTPVDKNLQIGDRISSTDFNKIVKNREVTVCNEGIKCYESDFIVSMNGDTLEIDLSGEIIVVHNTVCEKFDNDKAEADIDVFCQSTNFEEGKNIGWWQVSIGSK